MPAILFGSIGTLAETSELQRRAFNLAFKAHGLDWDWQREAYRKLLVYSGGEQRIAAWAIQQKEQKVDAHAIHATKSEIYQKLLSGTGLSPRSGVLEVIRAAKQQGIAVGLVSATSVENVNQLIAALHPHLEADDFALLTNSTLFARRKPEPDAYLFALQKLGLQASECIAIEDNADGLASATAAGIQCIAFPGENTEQHDYSAAVALTHHLRFEALTDLIPAHNAVQ